LLTIVLIYNYHRNYLTKKNNLTRTKLIKIIKNKLKNEYLYPDNNSNNFNNFITVLTLT